MLKYMISSEFFEYKIFNMLFDNNNKILLTLIKKKKDQRGVIKKEKIKILILTFRISQKKKYLVLWREGK